MAKETVSTVPELSSLISLGRELHLECGRQGEVFQALEKVQWQRKDRTPEKEVPERSFQILWPTIILFFIIVATNCWTTEKCTASSAQVRV